LPSYAAVGIVLTVLIAVVQGTTGYWLGRALTPLPVADESVLPVEVRRPSRGRHAAPRGR
jgi:hypothetical protein